MVEWYYLDFKPTPLLFNSIDKRRGCLLTPPNHVCNKQKYRIKAGGHGPVTTIVHIKLDNKYEILLKQAHKNMRPEIQSESTCKHKKFILHIDTGIVTSCIEVQIKKCKKRALSNVNMFHIRRMLLQDRQSRTLLQLDLVYNTCR